ncbi:hypothetical protein [Scytonema sp. HK-05]|uniref:hypothetical protein n=1 Tax=Scytonema sp. HK-05 TaxID=1137095 RepID=UPI003FD14529
MDNKGNKQWAWLALDAGTREIVGVYIRIRCEVCRPLRECIITFLALPGGFLYVWMSPCSPQILLTHFFNHQIHH